MAQTDDEPIAIKSGGWTGRPERHQFLLLGQQSAVRHRIPHQQADARPCGQWNPDRYNPAEYARNSVKTDSSSISCWA